MGRLISKQTYDSPAEYADTLTRAQFEIRVKFLLFDREGQGWANDTVSAVMDEWGWCLGTTPDAVRIEQIPAIIGERVEHRMVVVTLSFDTGWVNSYEVGEWWSDYIEDPALWEGECPDYDRGEFVKGMEAQLRRMAGSLQNVDVFVRSLEVGEDR